MKIKFPFFLFLFVVNSILLSAQITTYTNFKFNEDSFDVFIVKIDTASLKRFNIIENKELFKNSEFTSSISKGTSLFSINASINDSGCNPIGYCVRNFKETSAVNLKNGNGNFYLKPNGALLIMEKSAVICEASKIKNYNSIRLGIQSGPMLILNGVINSNFNASSTNKNIRSGVGFFTNDKKESFLIFSTSVNPISFYTFSLFFNKKFNCANALCLESVNCSMNLPYLNSSSSKAANVICNYIVYHIN